ncbi:MAG: ATP-binding protein [Rhodospirillales bacterium]|nr:ATP-binding protein [Rhodospirillales bacterium]
MSLPTIFEICEPRDDVVRGTIQESDFAADLKQVITGEAPEETKNSALFFANTHPTQGLKNLLLNVCRRLSGHGGEVSSIFRLHTQYGGGKTHALIALTHAANGMQGVGNVAEFLDPGLVPHHRVRIAAFDGENADPASGLRMGDGIRAFTPWGEIAYRLGGTAGYEAIRANDEKGIAPGADNLRSLFGGEPALILLDELAVYLRAVRNQPVADQLVRFLTNLFKAVEGTPNAAVVYTLAIGKGGKAEDAYGSEHQFIADRMAEAESVSARKATLLDPTTEDETSQVIRRRLFKSIDDARAAAIIAEYQSIWNANRDYLPPERTGEDRIERFRLGYPLHPELMATLTNKLSTLGNFQRVRGMLRLLARAVEHAWRTRPC